MPFTRLVLLEFENADILLGSMFGGGICRALFLALLGLLVVLEVPETPGPTPPLDIVGGMLGFGDIFILVPGGGGPG